jgi:two-component sensor histidine kinase
VAGIVAATLDMSFFASFYRSLNLGAAAICAILNEDGWMVARHPLDDETVNRKSSFWPLFSEKLAAAPTGTFVRDGSDGIFKQFAYRRMDSLPLVIITALPLDDVVAGWRARTLRNGGIVLALLALVQGALWLAWRALKRERALARGLRRALDDNITLFNEIHHRVKNNMQIVSSMLMIEQIRAGNGALAERLQLVADRVASMALVHTMLYERQEASRVQVSAYLHELCRNLAEGHGTVERGIRIEVEADDTCLAMEHAVPLGLLVNEAVLNAIKHAFPDGRGGTIRIRFDGTAAGGFALTVADDGVGLTPQPKGNGIGTTLMHSLAGQLDASASLGACPRHGGTAIHVWRGMPHPAAPELVA